MDREQSCLPFMHLVQVNAVAFGRSVLCKFDGRGRSVAVRSIAGVRFMWGSV
uniref:Uncharacterized protein n=1 Tax=Setaria viridis TaxID=4556 RepID=A0A4V6DBZ1_SETVI|nr:hypothetical protein SEVIR_2G374350v2 [Setaria viridis]